MQKLIFSLFLSFNLIGLNAQQDYKSKLASLVKYSKTDFSKIKGPLIEAESDDDIDVFESTFKLGVGEEYITTDKKSKTTIYFCTSKYKDLDSKNLELSVNDFIDENFPDSKFDIQRDDLGYDGAYYRTAIYPKKEESPAVFILELKSDVHIDTELTIIIPGKTT